jgi:hypothetical protein
MSVIETDCGKPDAGRTPGLPSMSMYLRSSM